MFEAVTKGFQAAKSKFSTNKAIAETDIEEAIRDIRLALLEADVDLGVTKTFISAVKDRAKAEILRGTAKMDVEGETKEITPYHRFVAICQEELELLMGTEEVGLDYIPMGVTAVMIVGLQGSGKTTTSAKIAKYLKEREEKKVLMVAADVQRPAAIDQLEQLGQRIEVPVYSERGGDPLALCGNALARAGKTKRDVVIFDTAGRLAIDEVLMKELKLIKDRTKPQEILLVVDSMIGQDAVRTAKAFDEALGITGFIMTKLDGDARGGAALSIKSITQKPIKFLGMGEGMDDIEAFRAEGLASRILGMGDVVGLVQEFERHVDQDKAEEDAERMFRGQFDMSDFVEQIQTLRKMGSLGDLLDKMPMFAGGLPEGFRPDEREFNKIESVYNSMTPLERRRPALMRVGNRIDRVAGGCGRTKEQVNDVLSRFDTMRRMMIALGDQPSLLAQMPGFDQLAKVRQLRGMDMSELFGDLFDLPPEEHSDGFDMTPEPDDDKPKEYFSHLANPNSGSGSGTKKKKNKQKKEKKARKNARKKNRRR